MTTIHDNKTSAQFIHDSQAEIDAILDPKKMGRMLAESKLRCLIKTAHLAGNFSGVSGMAKEVRGR